MASTTENFNSDDGSKGVYILKFILYNINSLSNKTGGEREETCKIKVIS